MALSLVTQYAAPRAGITGSTVRVFQDVKFDNSYPTGGYAFTPANVGLSSILFLVAGSASGYSVHYDYSGQKLQVYSAAGTEVSNATDLSAVYARLLVFGHGFATAGLK